MNTWFKKIWGGASGILNQSARLGWVDFVLLMGLGGLFFGLFGIAGAVTTTSIQAEGIKIDLSPWALPKYTFFSMMRGMFAYVLSLVFTLIYGYWAAKDQIARKVLIPLLDVLQSIPILSVMPTLVLAMIAFFPASHRYAGLEFAAVITIFMGQAWNMTYSYYQSLRSVPGDQREAAAVYRFDWWERLKWVELPFSTMGLVWNSMMSMAGGWFFLMVSETVTFPDSTGKAMDCRLPGVGSYMAEAVAQKDSAAQTYAIIAMVLMIVLLDQLVWRPVVVWAQKFRVEEGGHNEAMTSWFLDWLRRSKILAWMEGTFLHSARANRPKPVETTAKIAKTSFIAVILSQGMFIVLLGSLAFGGWLLIDLLRKVDADNWRQIGISAIYTVVRVMAAVAIGTVIAVPAGLAIGLSPRLSRFFQPIVQIVASFPAPMLFPLVVAILNSLGFSLEWVGSIALMLLGTQSYILFNVIAGAMAMPADLREMARSFNLSLWDRFWTLYLPACFPYLVTGWVTAAGGAWNASIIAEYIQLSNDSEPMKATGLGELITMNAGNNQALNAAATVTMSAMVLMINYIVWRRLYKLAEERYSLSK